MKLLKICLCATLASYAAAFCPTPTSLLATRIPAGGSNAFVKTSSLDAVAPAAAVTVASIALPSAKHILATTLLPTCLGYYRYEYGVSYGYGTATAATAYLALRALQTSSTSAFASIAQIHALAIIFYGLRLNSFLLFREICFERFKRMRETIEDRQRKKEDGTGIIGKFLNRTPFILSCAMLYAGLASSPLISAKLIEMGAAPTCDKAILMYKTLVGLTWFGFALGAIGDVTKSFVKGRKGPDYLVTGGVFSLFRHPNYTGEVIGWSSSFLSSVVAVLCTSGVKLSVLKTMAAPLGLAFVGALGIIFVLGAATTNLEKRQKEKYGESKEYEDWVSSSWSGPKLAPTKKKD
jgi:steroid 5-alpha reductase family enzyme